MLSIRTKRNVRSRPRRLRDDLVEFRADLTVVIHHCPAASILGSGHVNPIRIDFKLRAFLHGRHDFFFDLGSRRRLERAGVVDLGLILGGRASSPVLTLCRLLAGLGLLLRLLTLRRPLLSGLFDLVPDAFFLWSLGACGESDQSNHCRQAGGRRQRASSRRVAHLNPPIAAAFGASYAAGSCREIVNHCTSLASRWNTFRIFMNDALSPAGTNA